MQPVTPRLAGFLLDSIPMSRCNAKLITKVTDSVYPVIGVELEPAKNGFKITGNSASFS